MCVAFFASSSDYSYRLLLHTVCEIDAGICSVLVDYSSKYILLLAVPVAQLTDEHKRTYMIDCIPRAHQRVSIIIHLHMYTIQPVGMCPGYFE